MEDSDDDDDAAADAANAVEVSQPTEAARGTALKVSGLTST